YLAHEYFGEHWRVTTFSEVAKWLDDAKLSFVASAHLLDHVEAVNLTAEGDKLLPGIKDPILRQSGRDHFVDQQIRPDVFIKGPRRLSALEREEAMRSDAFALATHADDVAMKVTGALGEATLQEQVYRPLIKALAENDYAPKTVDQLAAHAQLKAMPMAQILQAILVLTGTAHVHPAQETASASRSRCGALNRYLCERARSVGDIHFLASPVIGGGVFVPRFHQLFLLALQLGKKSEAEQAAFTWGLLSAQGERGVKDGKVLETPEENIAELT